MEISFIECIHVKLHTFLTLFDCVVVSASKPETVPFTQTHRETTEEPEQMCESTHRGLEEEEEEESEEGWADDSSRHFVFLRQQIPINTGCG